jgi:hypothetical protein
MADQKNKLELDNTREPYELRESARNEERIKEICDALDSVTDLESAKQSIQKLSETQE